MSGVIVFLTAIIVTVVFRTDAGLAGLALTSALNLTGVYASKSRSSFQGQFGSNFWLCIQITDIMRNQFTEYCNCEI